MNNNRYYVFLKDICILLYSACQYKMIICSNVIARHVTLFSIMFTFQFDLVCSKSIYATLALAAVFVGFFFGAIIIGPFTDRFGRKPTIFISGLVIALFSLVSAFSKVFWLFVVSKIIVGLGVGKNLLDS